MRNSKRILIDARMVGPKPHGIARFVVALATWLKEFSETGLCPYQAVFLVSRDLPQGSAIDFFERIESAHPFLCLGEILGLKAEIKRAGVDAYHSTSFSAPIGVPCPWISTVHDLNHLQFGSLVQKLYYRLRVKPFALGAQAVTTVSEFSRQELAPWLGVPQESISITPNVLSRPLVSETQESKRTLDRLGLTRGSYLICLANNKPHRNLERLIRAFSKTGGKLCLVISVPEASFESCPGLVQTGPLDDRDVTALVNSAAALIAPSLYEGFGLPPLEALVAKTPIIVSDIAPHRESLAGLKLNPEGCVVWVGPQDESGWTVALRAAMSVSPPRPGAQLSEEILSRFSSQALGNAMDPIYRRVLGLKQ